MARTMTKWAGLALAASLGGAAPAFGDVLVNYADFSSTAGLTLIGSAATASSSDGSVLRLTPAAGNQSAAAYSATAITLGANATFSTTFQFRFTDPGGWDPADGITFVLAASPTGLGGGGVGMGYQGVGNSVAIEFDTYNNAGYGLGNNDGNSSNHVSIDVNGALNNANLVNVYGNGSCGFASGNPAQNDYTAAGCMANGNLWSVTISYDGSALSLTMKDGSAGSFVVYANLPIDIATALGTNAAYVGFTSGTGAGWENHDIINWQFADTVELAATVPEPTSTAMLLAGLGLVGAVVARRRRR